MEHPVAFQGIVGLSSLSLSSSKQIAGLCVIHLSNQLTFAYTLTLTDKHALDNTHTGKTYGSTLTFLNNTHIRLTAVVGGSAHYFGLYPCRGFLHVFFLIAIAASHRYS